MSQAIILDDESSDEGVWFTPDFVVKGVDNRELPIESQCRVRILPMSGRDKLMVDHNGVLKTRALKKSKDIYATVARREWAKQKKILKTRVVELANWRRSVKNADGSKRIEDVKEVGPWIDMLENSSAALLDVLDQVYLAILDQSQLDEEFAGESVSPLDSR